MQTRRALPAALLGAAVLAATAWVLPKSTRNPLTETAVWSLLVVVSFAGWGSAVRVGVAPKERVDLGLRAMWGAGLVCFLGGLLMVPALMTRTSALLLVEVGLVFALIALWRERSAVRSRFAFAARFIRREPRISFLIGIGLGFFALHYLGAIADSHTNPYDDDIAYLAFAKKLLDTGTVIEPFSFRRLSALGGQTLFVALLWLRAGAERSHTFDRSVCILLILLLVAGYRSKARRTNPVVVLMTMALLLTLPVKAINTASYFSGVAFFLVLFRTVAWAARRDASARAWTSALPLALVGSAACTLRQNYLPIPVIMLAASYGLRLFGRRRSLETEQARSSSFGRDLAELLYAAGLSLVCIVPWLVVSWQSNRTFLYPVLGGTFNPALALKASDPSILRELKLQIGVFLEGVPIPTLGLFVLAAAVVREDDSRRPLASLGIATAVGFVLMVHGFSQSDAMSIGRYVFGSAAAAVIAVLLVTMTTKAFDETSELPGSNTHQRTAAALRRRARTAAAIVVVATLTQLTLSLITRTEGLLLSDTYKQSLTNIGMLARSAPPPRVPDPHEAYLLYRRMQDSIPEKARAAVLLDEPYRLEFSRNPIWNLDMPGYSSLPPGLPFFQGSDKVEEYFAKIGVRYLAFVTSDHSTYHYRREYWVERLVDETELWRSFAPYLIDFLDNLTALSTKHKRLFEERGMIVIDLGEQR